MKTITGKVTSSAPVCISKAASIISKFVSAETGASQAICAYLSRATAAFDELVRLHSKSDRRKHSTHKSRPINEELPTPGLEMSEKRPSEADLSHMVEAEMNKESKKKKKKSEKEKDGSRSSGDGDGKTENGGKEEHNLKKVDFSILVEGGKGRLGNNEGTSGEGLDGKKHKKKEEVRERERGSFSNFEENAGELAGRKGEGGGKMVVLEQRKKKKRKSGEVEEERTDGSEKRQTKKKKKRRRSGEGGD